VTFVQSFRTEFHVMRGRDGINKVGDTWWWNCTHTSKSFDDLQSTAFKCQRKKIKFGLRFFYVVSLTVNIFEIRLVISETKHAIRKMRSRHYVFAACTLCKEHLKMISMQRSAQYYNGRAVSTCSVVILFFDEV
jgi:hypothetical protein